jgi:hypothetical protein
MELLEAILDAQAAVEIGQIETQVHRRSSLASSTQSQVMSSWSGIQSFPTDHAGTHTQSAAAGTVIPETSQKIDALRICST